jgi:ketosteroid isomerase-like protein
MLQVRGVVYLIVLAVTISVPAQEPVKPPLSRRIITATRQVSIFTNLETQLLKAIQAKDHATLKNLVADDCMIEMPDADPLPAEDWLATVLAKDFMLKKFGVRQVSAVEMGNVVVVKFDRLQEAAYKGAPATGEFFVIDLWRKDGDSWKLASRYVSKVSSVVPPSSDVKPTGKQ